MEGYDAIGIESLLDWPRIRKLLSIGLFASLLAFAGDFILGYGVADESLTGMEQMLSAYVGLSDTKIFWSSFLGFLGITLEVLSYFGIYRLMAERSPRCAHNYRTGILGYMMFAACGVHVMMLACLFVYKHLMLLTGDYESTIALMLRFAKYFLLPTFVIFLIFSGIFCGTQIAAFAKGYTPYPKWCWIFNVLVGMILVLVITAFGHSAFVNALRAGYMSLGNIWMFAGLLITMKKAEGAGESGR